MHTAIETRNANYFEHRDSGRLSAQQRQIMVCLHGGHQADWSLREIQKLTGLDINVVSGRVNELKNSSPFPYLVESQQRKCCITGRTVTPVRINRGQLDLFGRAA